MINTYEFESPNDIWSPNISSILLTGKTFNSIELPKSSSEAESEANRRA